MKKRTKRHTMNTKTNTMSHKKDTAAISIHLDEMLEMVTEKENTANDCFAFATKFTKILETSDSYEGVPHNDSVMYRDFTLAIKGYRDTLGSYTDDLYSFRNILTSYIALRKEFLELKQNQNPNPNQEMILARPLSY